jgi:hypothetical protein
MWTSFHSARPKTNFPAFKTRDRFIFQVERRFLMRGQIDKSAPSDSGWKINLSRVLVMGFVPAFLFAVSSLL